MRWPIRSNQSCLPPCRRCALLSVLAVSFLAAALPDPLSSDDLAAGWIRLFDGETTFGWRIDGEGQASNGELHLGGSKATHAELTTNLGFGEFRYVLNGITSTKQIGFAHDIMHFHVRPGSKLVFTDVKFKPLKMQSIFNGKDFTGW